MPEINRNRLLDLQHEINEFMRNPGDISAPLLSHLMNLQTALTQAAGQWLADEKGFQVQHRR